MLRRLRALARNLPAGLAGDVRGVHQARVASRRLRDTVPVVAAATRDEKSRKKQRTLKRLTRALGTVREMDVALAMLGERPLAGASPRPAVELVRARLNGERASRRRLMVERVAAIDFEKLARRVREAARAAAMSGRETAWRGALARRLARRAILLRGAIEAAGALYEPEALHKVRIAVKKLRYALELADETGAAPARAEVVVLKTMQDTLGRLHDLQVLRAHVRAIAAGPTRRQAVSVDALDTVGRAMEDESRALHARYMAVVPRLRELWHHVARTLVPSVRTSAMGTARPRPLKMMLQRARAERRIVPSPESRVPSPES